MKHDKRHVLKHEETCKNFFGRQYYERLSVCSQSDHYINQSIVCMKNPVSTMMAKCTIRGLVLDKSRMINPVPKLKIDAVKVRQLVSERFNCPAPSLSKLYSYTEESDHLPQLVKRIIQKKPLRSDECRLWFNDTTYVFCGDHHIYFRFLGWYNLFKTIYYDGNQRSKIIRLTEDPYFSDVEKRIFPNLITISDLKSFPVCIKNATLVPRSFTSTPFRCKMELKSFCSDCLLQDFDEPTWFEFKTSMLRACSIDTSDQNLISKRKMVIILRKPYKRYAGDENRVFERVMINETDLLNALRSNFASFTVLPVYMEDLTLCEQINISSSAHVFLGVHGAGMSHLWWTPKGATILELMPDYKSSKPSFEVLSNLIKAKYLKVRVEGEKNITVNIDEVINTLKYSMATL